MWNKPNDPVQLKDVQPVERCPDIITNVATARQCAVSQTVWRYRTLKLLPFPTDTWYSDQCRFDFYSNFKRREGGRRGSSHPDSWNISITGSSLTSIETIESWAVVLHPDPQVPPLPNSTTPVCYSLLASVVMWSCMLSCVFFTSSQQLGAIM